MIPATFDWLPALPTGPNGKLDRSALPRPAAVATAAVTPPRDKVEEQLAAIWTEVLGVAEVSVTCGFFELGGHSLLAARIVARIRRDFGVDVPAARLLGGDSSIEALALAVQETQWSQASPEELSRMLADLEELSDSQVASLLEQDSESH
jgi:acyl carrier protein